MSTSAIITISPRPGHELPAFEVVDALYEEVIGDNIDDVTSSKDDLNPVTYDYYGWSKYSPEGIYPFAMKLSLAEKVTVKVSESWDDDEPGATYSVFEDGVMVGDGALVMRPHLVRNGVIKGYDRDLAVRVAAAPSQFPAEVIRNIINELLFLAGEKDS